MDMEGNSFRHALVRGLARGHILIRPLLSCVRHTCRHQQFPAAKSRERRAAKAVSSWCFPRSRVSLRTLELPASRRTISTAYLCLYVGFFHEKGGRPRGPFQYPYCYAQTCAARDVVTMRDYSATCNLSCMNGAFIHIFWAG